MLDSSLYDISQISKRLTTLGFSVKEIASNMVQMGDKLTTIYVKKSEGYILFATQEVYNQIVLSSELKDIVRTFSPKSKNEAVDFIENNHDTGKILCLLNGNKIIHLSSAGNYNPHEIHIYSNNAFDAVFEMITGHKFKVVAPESKTSVGDSDGEAQELLQESIDSQIRKYLKIFNDNLKKYREEEKTLEALRQKFVSDYTMQRIINMTKEEYVVGLGTNDSFCYRLETELQDLGNIHGATARKFGLYYGTSGDDTENKYRVTKKFGTDPDKALVRIKEQIVKLRMAGAAKDFDAIHACEFGPLFRGKILSTFFPEDYLAIFSNEHLDYFMARLGIDFTASEDILDKQKKLIEWKKSQPELKNLSNCLFGKFLYSSFGRPFEEVKEDKDYQKSRDEEYPKKYVTRISITIDQWKSLLQDGEVFLEKDIALVKRFYLADNHATTCYDLGAQDGVSPSTYIKPVVALARRISAKMSLAPVYGDDGSQVWWRIVFWGRYREDARFEWKLQPKLARALQDLYPELDANEVNDDEDQNLIRDLKPATLASMDDNFEYKGQVKKKSPAVFTNGHKTYPRDRQTAINALAHAHYLCEIDVTHPTFIRKNSDKNYTEPHHLVPMAFSDEFVVSLDVEENIVSLCSNCHNQIHYGKDAGELIKKLYENRKESLESVGIKISLARLLQMYNL